MFLFRLAEHLHMSVGAVLGLSHAELQGWKAFHKMKKDAQNG